MRRFLRGAAFLPLVGGLAGAAAFAQTTGAIEGRVLDSAGLPVEGAAVVACSASLQGERSVGSAADGWFRLLALPPGEYVVTAGRSGFRQVEASGVRVSLDRTVTLRMRLDPGRRLQRQDGERRVGALRLRPMADHAAPEPRPRAPARHCPDEP